MKKSKRSSVIRRRAVQQSLTSWPGWRKTEGQPYPLGVTWIEEDQAYNFALYAKDAETVTLSLFRQDDVINPTLTYRFDYLRNKSGRIWHCRVPKSAGNGATLYAYMVDGPRSVNPLEWQTFDPEKSLLDPYAKAVFFPATFERQAAILQGSNKGRAPLGLIEVENGFDWSEDIRPRHEVDAVIYELHVKGFTNHPSSGVGRQERGTFSGLRQKIPYLTELGVTVVELMPIFQHDPQEGNYWGYMPLNFFAPHQGYAGTTDLSRQLNEFRSMVKALHEADIEVILDVVYKHTAEGDEDGPLYS